MLGAEGASTGWHLDWEAALNVLLRVLETRSSERNLPSEVVSQWAVLGSDPHVWDRLKGDLLENDIPALKQELCPPTDPAMVNTGSVFPIRVTKQALHLYHELDYVAVWDQVEGDIMAPRVGEGHAVMNLKGLSLKLACDYLDWNTSLRIR